MDSIVGREFFSTASTRFEKLKIKAEKSIEQVKNDKDLYWLPNNETNSIAILVKHLSGNMKSRWTKIFETDGEKPDRNRPSEFDVLYRPTREELLTRWNEGWNYLFTTLQKLKQDDLMRKIKIRAERVTVLSAILKQLTHYAEHVGQIIFLAKQIEWKNWKTLSIPRDKEVFDYRELS